jgi:hypothetical protein
VKRLATSFAVAGRGNDGHLVRPPGQA